MESEIEQLCWLYEKKKEVIGVDLKEQGDESVPVFVDGKR